MSELNLEKVRIVEGVWEGRLSREASYVGIPQVNVMYMGQPVDSFSQEDVADNPDEWVLKVPIPIELVSEGVHTFIISDAKTDEVLNSFSIIAGDALAEDIRAEVNLLRGELEMLKRAFRRHCLETSG